MIVPPGAVKFNSYTVSSNPYLPDKYLARKTNLIDDFINSIHNNIIFIDELIDPEIEAVKHTTIGQLLYA